MGDGKSINIWEDRWLPETEDGIVKAKDVEGIKVQRVSELIKDGKWDKELIAQVFEEEKGRKIMRIPLSVQPMKNRIYWVMSSTGVYTVKSRYILAKNMKRREGQWRSGAEFSYRSRSATQS